QVDADHVYPGHCDRDRDTPRPDGELDDRAARGHGFLDVEVHVLDDRSAPRVVDPGYRVVDAHGDSVLVVRGSGSASPDPAPRPRHAGQPLLGPGYLNRRTAWSFVPPSAPCNSVLRASGPLVPSLLRWMRRRSRQRLWPRSPAPRRRRTCRTRGLRTSVAE